MKVLLFLVAWGTLVYYKVLIKVYYINNSNHAMDELSDKKVKVCTYSVFSTLLPQSSKLFFHRDCQDTKL